MVDLGDLCAADDKIDHNFVHVDLKKGQNVTTLLSVSHLLGILTAFLFKSHSFEQYSGVYVSQQSVGGVKTLKAANS